MPLVGVLGLGRIQPCIIWDCTMQADIPFSKLPNHSKTTKTKKHIAEIKFPLYNYSPSKWVFGKVGVKKFSKVF